MRFLFLAVLALATGGCDTPNTRFSHVEFGDTKALAAGGNLRLVTQRERRNSAEDPSTRVVFCTEPSPDYAVGFKRVADGGFEASITGQTTTTGRLKLESDEKVEKGEGREAGVLALRDGLYAACQAYANGVIGHDAYSVILSQYGLLIAAVANPLPDGVTAYTPSPASSAFAAMLVACLSGHDPTRLSPLQGETRNPLLTRGLCTRVLARAGRA